MKVEVKKGDTYDYRLGDMFVRQSTGLAYQIQFENDRYRLASLDGCTYRGTRYQQLENLVLEMKADAADYAHYPKSRWKLQLVPIDA